MAFNFPDSPTNGQTVTAPNGVVYTWDGTKWVPVSGAMTAYAPLDSPALTGNPTAPTPAPGDNDTSIATTAFTRAAVAAALNDVGRNLIHNPLFNVAQRGAGPFAASLYTADRWFANIDGTSTASFVIAAHSDTGRAQIGDEAAQYYLANTFTGGAGVASYLQMSQRIEKVRSLAGKTVTVSFWAYASASLKFGVSLDQNFGSGGSPSPGVSGVGQVATLTPGFVRYTFTFTVPSVAGKTFGTNGDDWTALSLWYSAGSSNNVGSGSVGVQSGSVGIWGVQLEVGTVATPLEKPDPVTDLAKCQRFFLKMAGLQASTYSSGTGAVTTSMFTWPTMHHTPTATPSGQVYGNASALVITVTSLAAANTYMTATGAGPLYCTFDVTLSADL